MIGAINKKVKIFWILTRDLLTDSIKNCQLWIIKITFFCFLNGIVVAFQARLFVSGLFHIFIQVISFSLMLFRGILRGLLCCMYGRIRRNIFLGIFSHYTQMMKRYMNCCLQLITFLAFTSYFLSLCFFFK